MNLLNILRAYKDEYYYNTKKAIYTVNAFTIKIDLYLLGFLISIPYWVTRQTHKEIHERLDALLQELIESRNVAKEKAKEKAKEEVKSKRKYVKKEPVKKGPGRPKKK